MPEHIQFKRESRAAPRRPVKRGFPGVQPPSDLDAFFRRTQKIIKDFKDSPTTQVAGYDERRLVKLKLSTELMPDQINNIEGLEFIDHDEDGVVVALASEKALAIFEERLSSLMQAEKVSEDNILYALKEFEEWAADDRMGVRIKSEPLPSGNFFVDVELWSLDNNSSEVQKMRLHFEGWLKENEIEIIDSLVIIPYYRLNLNQNTLNVLLNHRDVRFVDLPPTFGIEPYDLSMEVEEFKAIEGPNENSAALAVLDTGITAGHPFIGAAVADAQSFITSDEATDNHGHGTWVSGIGLYGDIKASIDAKSFVPTIWILSGRVLDGNSEYDRKIILNSISDAVDYFLGNYDCRIFNISFGDSKYPYKGGRLQSFAVGLDILSRESNILFVVSAGNFNVADVFDDGNIQDSYPKYLSTDDAKIIDPASSVNSITVGSIAEYESPPYSDPDKIKHLPLANTNFPSPFTRSGPSINGVVKPDFVDYGGNYSYDPSMPNMLHQSQLGQVTLSKDFLKEGKLFKLVNGTSFAAPRVAHMATRLHSLMPDVRMDTIRAVLGANSNYPLTEQQKSDLFSEFFDSNSEGHLSDFYGYGKIDENWLFSSGDEVVTIYSEDAITDDENHFYEIPLPNDFVTGIQRYRKYTVSLAHTPSVRHSRLDYTATRIRFRLKYASSIDEVASIFSDKENAVKMGEDTIGSNVHQIGPKKRDKGTLQVSQFAFKASPKKIANKKLYLAVIRQDRYWSKNSSQVLHEEPYSIALRYQDLDAEHANLYNTISAEIQLREQAQSKQRIRT